MSEQESQLCHVCSAFPLQTFFNEEPEVDDSSPHRYSTFRSYKWGWNHMVAHQASCRTCAFLLEAVHATTNLDGDLWFEEMYVTVERCIRKRYDPLEDEETESVRENEAPYPGVVSLHNRELRAGEAEYDSDESGVFSNKGEFCCFILPVGNESHAVDSLGCGRRMEPKLSDFSLMKRWIKLCDEGHGEHCTKPMTGPSMNLDLRVIDVELNAVCELPKGSRYLTLSYCWGGFGQLTLTKENLEAFAAPGALGGDGVCATVRDAMIVTAQLGERYLWVDSLCIVQDDDEDREFLIRMMDRIYHYAYLTIIATDGADCSQGIPGISYDRTKQAFMNGGPGQQSLVSLSDYWGNSLLKSPWNKRGWTLQEKLCSRRALIMQNSKVLFQCGEVTWDEDVHLETAVKEPRYNSNDLQPISRLIDDFKRAKSGQMGQRVIWEALNTILYRYYERHLSLDTDILNAFAGILGMLQPHVGPFSWGLPVRAFHMHLGWVMSTGPSKARVGFPSWSWAGWYGNRNRHSMVHFNVDAHPLLSIQTVNKSGFRQVASNAPDVLSTTQKHPHFAYNDLLESDFHSVLVNRDLPMGTHLSHLLFFSTSSKKLRLGKYIGRHYQDDRRGVYTLEQPGSGRVLRTVEQTRFAKNRVSDDTERPPGISLYCKWVAEHGQVHDFLVVAHGVEPESWFQLMLVKWIEGIAFRIHVTKQVAVDDWWASDPEQKHVVLG